MMKHPKIEWHKLITLLAVVFGFVIVQECLVLMLLCVLKGYTAAAAWLTAAVGVGEAIIIGGTSFYISIAKSDHKEGGITYEAAKANGFKKPSDNNSPAI